MLSSQRANRSVTLKPRDDPGWKVSENGRLTYDEIALHATRAIQTTPRIDLLTSVVAIDREFQLAYVDSDKIQRVGRVSIVNYHGRVIYDVFAYYTNISGYQKKLPPQRLQLGVYWKDIQLQNGACPIEEVEDTVYKLVSGRIVVGHAIQNDVKVFSDGIFKDVAGLKDTQLHEPYRRYGVGQQRLPKLSTLVVYVLGKTIQLTDHSSVEDAQATMELYVRAEKSMESNSNASMVNFLGSNDDTLDEYNYELEAERNFIDDDSSFPPLTVPAQPANAPNVPLSATVSFWQKGEAYIQSSLTATANGIMTARPPVILRRNSQSGSNSVSTLSYSTLPETSATSASSACESQSNTMSTMSSMSRSSIAKGNSKTNAASIDKIATPAASHTGSASAFTTITRKNPVAVKSIVLSRPWSEVAKQEQVVDVKKPLQHSNRMVFRRTPHK